MKSKRTKAVDIPYKVKRKVWDRDSQCCILCGNPQAMPNAHYIPRSHGGLGIEQNIVTLCWQCHHDYDNGGKREEYGVLIADYLRACYKNWDKMKLTYEKWSDNDGPEDNRLKDRITE